MAGERCFDCSGSEDIRYFECPECTRPGGNRPRYLVCGPCRAAAWSCPRCRRAAEASDFESVTASSQSQSRSSGVRSRAEPGPEPEPEQRRPDRAGVSTRTGRRASSSAAASASDSPWSSVAACSRSQSSEDSDVPWRSIDLNDIIRLTVGEVRRIGRRAPPPGPPRSKLGYLQYSAGDQVWVYIGTETVRDQDWVFGTHVATGARGWLHRDCFQTSDESTRPSSTHSDEECGDHEAERNERRCGGSERCFDCSGSEDIHYFECPACTRPGGNRPRYLVCGPCRAATWSCPGCRRAAELSDFESVTASSQSQSPGQSSEKRTGRRASSSAAADSRSQSSEDSDMPWTFDEPMSAMAADSQPQLMEGEVRRIGHQAPPPEVESGYGYLQYSAGDQVWVEYIGTETEGDQDWVFGMHMATGDRGWLRRACFQISGDDVLPLARTTGGMLPRAFF